MKRNDFVRRAVTSVGQNLPPDWEEKVVKFRDYVDQNQAGLETWQIGNMDEVPVTSDLPGNFTIEKTSVLAQFPFHLLVFLLR